jgi:hypothetical protein
MEGVMDYYYDIIIYQGRMSDRYEQAMDQWAMDRYEQQEQVRQDEGINLILIYKTNLRSNGRSYGLILM